MFDLNMSIDFNKIVAAPSPEGESSATNGGAFSSLAATQKEEGSGLVTRELFPVSRLDELNRLRRQNEQSIAVMLIIIVFFLKCQILHTFHFLLNFIHIFFHILYLI